MLKLDFQFLRGNHVSCFPDDLSKFARLDSVIVVVSDPNLEKNVFHVVIFSPTVDKGALNEANFSNMKVRGDTRIVGEF